MKASLFLVVLLVTCFFYTPVYAQTKRINISVKNQKLSDVFKIIENKTNYSFLYNSSLINTDSIVSIQVRNKSISNILKRLLSNKIDCIVKYDKIILLLKEEKIKTWYGRVLALDSNTPLPGVSIMVKGTFSGVASNIDGLFSVKAKEGDVLLVSFIGMETLEHKLYGNNNIEIYLSHNSTNMREVVVTALGINKSQRSVNYSVTELKTAIINAVKVPNFISSLSGRVAGVNIISSFNLGGGNNIVIRGGSSITGNNQALFVLDGIALNNVLSTGSETARGAGGYDFGNLVSDINLDNIEKVDILKGGASTALYGSRGANGVILLTSKKPSNKKRLGFSFSSSIIFNTIDKSTLPNYQRQYGGGSKDYFERKIINGTEYNIVEYSEDFSWGPKFDSSISVLHWDAFDSSDKDNYLIARPWEAPKHGPSEFFKTGCLFVNSFSFSGKNEKASIRMFFADTKDNASIDNSYLKKKNISLYAHLNLKKNFSSTISARLINVYAKNRPKLGYDWDKSLSFMASAGMWMQTNVDYRRLRNYKRSDNGNMKTWNRASVDIAEPVFWENPYWTLNNNYPEDTRNRIIASWELNYRLNSNLSFKSRINIDDFFYKLESRIKKGSYAKSYYKKAMSFYGNYNYDFFINYKKILSPNLNLTSVLGFSRRKNSYELLSASSKSKLLIDDFYSVSNSLDASVNTQDYESVKIVNSIFNISSLNYKNFLFLDCSFRNDWSSTLPVNNNSFLYPSLSFSYIFDDFLKMDFLSFAKLRFSWAMVGNDTGFSLLYDAYRNYGNMSTTYRYGRNKVKMNENLKPEQVETRELGLDLCFFSNRINLDLSYYDKYSRDLIIPSLVSITTGYYRKYINAGVKRDKGLEISLKLTPILTKDFVWNLNCNWSTNKSKILSLSSWQDTHILNSNHVALIAKVSYPYGVLSGSNFIYNSKGEKVINSKGFYKQSVNSEILGDINPDWRAGVSNIFRYKSFTFSSLVDFKIGGDLFSMTNYWGEQSGILKSTVGLNDLGNQKRLPISEGGGVVLDGVQEDGLVNTVRVETYEAYNSENKPKASSIFDSSYIKLRELSLSYVKRKIKHNKFNIDELSLSIVARNVCTLYKNVDNIDPESSYGVNNVQGLDVGSMPSYSSLGFSVKINF